MNKIFASQTIPDQRPWRYVLLDPNGQAREATQVTGGFIYDPRPQKLPVNRVLAEVRKRENTPEGWQRVLRCIAMNRTTPEGYLQWDYNDRIEASPEEIAHAERVLMRLVDLRKAEEKFQEGIRAWWKRLIGDRYEYELVRRDELKPGDLAVSSHWGLRTVKTAKQYGNTGQTTHIMWTDTNHEGVPFGERYDSKGLIARVTQCGAENPDYPGEYSCTYPRGHGKINEPKDDVRDMDHGAPASGAWWIVAPTETPRDRHRTQGYKTRCEQAPVEHSTEWGVKLTDPESHAVSYRWNDWQGWPHTRGSAVNDAKLVYRRDFSPTVVSRAVTRETPRELKA